MDAGRGDVLGVVLLLSWGTPVEVERRRRILLALWAYAYERGDQLVEDHVYDREAYLVDLTVETASDQVKGSPQRRRFMKLDRWYRENYVPYSGQWVAGHPERDKLERLHRRAIDRVDVKG